MKFLSPPDQAEYRRKVWEVVRQIPEGQVATYGQIAALIPPPKGVDPGDYAAWSARWVGVSASASCLRTRAWNLTTAVGWTCIYIVGLAPPRSGASPMDWYRVEVVEMATQYRVDPRIRAYGKARIDVTRRAHDEREWQSLWHEPRYPFPFTWGDGWKQCMQYTVADFAAEIGFFIDILGFPVSAFSPNYAQFTSPDQAFYFSVVAVQEGGQITSPDSLSIQFMLDDLEGTILKLEQRGIVFERKPEPGAISPPIAVLRSPHGVSLELWGVPQAQPEVQPEVIQSAELADFWSDEGAEDATDSEESENEKDPAQMEFEDLEDDDTPEE